jgi:hypothetical protein
LRAPGTTVGEQSLVISWFENKGQKGKEALGDPEATTWELFTSIFEWRREGEKDGCGFVPAKFKLEADGRQVRRLKDNVLARTAIALDIETNKKTGEGPPNLSEAMERASALGLACLGYTSHNHHLGNIRYRLVMPLSVGIAPDLPAPEIMADFLGLASVLDGSKIGPASLFYLPSAPYDALGCHQTAVIFGAPIDAAWMTNTAGALLAARRAEADRIAAQAQAQAAARRKAKLVAGFDPDDSLIEKLRSRLDLDSILTSHGYDKAGTKYRHPRSSSDSYGADIKVLGGVERVFSHNATDPLHATNLPPWCDVTAIDAFDVVVILDFGGDRQQALKELAQRFGLTKTAERKELAKLLFQLLRNRAEQDVIEAAAFAFGAEVGLSRDEVCSVAVWVASQTGEMGKAA